MSEEDHDETPSDTNNRLGSDLPEDDDDMTQQDYFERIHDADNNPVADSVEAEHDAEKEELGLHRWFLNKMRAELKEKLAISGDENTWGKQNDQSLYNVLMASKPYPRRMPFLTSHELEYQTKLSSPWQPIFARDVRRRQWKTRPIEEIFEFAPDLDAIVSVQVPSQPLTDASYQQKSLRDVKNRFLNDTSQGMDPWNILDLDNWMSQRELPEFLDNPKCSLLNCIRHQVLNPSKATRSIVTPAWKDMAH